MQTTVGRVAIVDDDVSMRISIERLLRAKGFATSAFASAEELLCSGALDGVVGLVLDIHLDGMSGIELRRRLAAAGSTIPVVFITGHDDEKSHADALAAGCVAYLRKPFDAVQLIAALDRGRGLDR